MPIDLLREEHRVKIAQIDRGLYGWWKHADKHIKPEVSILILWSGWPLQFA